MQSSVPFRIQIAGKADRGMRKKRQKVKFREKWRKLWSVEKKSSLCNADSDY